MAAGSSAGSVNFINVNHRPRWETEMVKISHTISVKLEFSTYFLWRQECESVIRSVGLKDFISNNGKPDPFINEGFGVLKINPLFIRWEMQDNVLFLWILSTLSDEERPVVLDCYTSFDIWHFISARFANLARAKSPSLTVVLGNIMLGSDSVSQYLLNIRNLIRYLDLGGTTTTAYAHVDFMLHGLPLEYQEVINTVLQRREFYSVEAVEQLILEREAHVLNNVVVPA